MKAGVVQINRMPRVGFPAGVASLVFWNFILRPFPWPEPQYAAFPFRKRILGGILMSFVVEPTLPVKVQYVHEELHSLGLVAEDDLVKELKVPATISVVVLNHERGDNASSQIQNIVVFQALGPGFRRRTGKDWHTHLAGVPMVEAFCEDLHADVVQLDNLTS